MKVLDTQHKRKSAVITAIILILLLIGIYNYGMKYLDPPIEYGLAINFGNSDVGSGEPVEKTKAQATPQQEEVVEEQEEEVSEETVKEEMITNDTAEEVPVVEKKKEEKKVIKEAPKETKPKEKPKPKPSKEATDALNSLLNGTSNNGANKGEGDDNQSGVKGNEQGDPSSDKYYGNSGSGSGGNYNLAGRKALSKPIEKPDCQEEGTVVVIIEVNQNGKVIKATPGAKGTTNSAFCLYDAAKKAALKTTWNADGNAPSKQRGTIIYKFSLSK
ncbi:energy transducer TonB [Tenacibaculum tangerinum]|uniref:Energy transducer TonB n=1 Tax=Tenacibaculum tangerinum TaxID=3038772 RepID=A0ABY8LA27_9FLAO|nr:energy transducer TonB [Tenacibaculum tangerinum]WGH76994.1 energy transducer TonB [Tenacibaculum tangerinum]